MEECFKCGIAGDKVRLFDAIAEEGIVKICQECAFSENIPIIRKPTTFQLKEEERRQTVYERLSKAAGLTPKPEFKKVQFEKPETSLRDIVDRNFKEGKLEKKPRPDLVDNFHWAIMTGRRRKKLSQAQLAEVIGESEAVIRMAEKGILPENDYKLINKLESYLDVDLIRRETRKIVEEKQKKQPVKVFDAKEPKELTIDDLRRMKKKKEEEIIMGSGEEDSGEEEEFDELDEESNEKLNGKNLSEEEIRDLLFKKRK